MDQPPSTCTPLEGLDGDAEHEERRALV